jgi:hypothetical protein
MGGNEVKVKAWLPISASANFEIEVDKDEWEKLTAEERHERFMREAHPVGFLCCHCSGEINSDLEVDELALDACPTNLDFEVEE